MEIRSTRVFFTLVLSTLLCCNASYVSAQVYSPGQFALRGIPVACGSVVTVVRSGIGDAARAIPGSAGQAPVILVDPSFLQSAPTPVLLFVYAHECGHHNVGSNENAADCWAAKLGRRQGWFDTTTMQFLVQTFQWNPGDWTHAPGPVRLQNIWNCYTSVNGGSPSQSLPRQSAQPSSRSCSRQCTIARDECVDECGPGPDRVNNPNWLECRHSCREEATTCLSDCSSND